MKSRIGGAKDLAHAAGAQHCFDLVRTQLRPGRDLGDRRFEQARCGFPGGTT
jgi:hypothetical protein